MNVVRFAGLTVLMAMAGCVSTREAVEREYERVIALPPAERIYSPNIHVDDVGRFSCDVYNLVHAKLKNYVDKTTNHRAFTGFMNDVQALMKDEGLSEEDAMKKVCSLVKEEDNARSDTDKLWPRIEAGWAAANALAPSKQLAEIAQLVFRNQQIIVRASSISRFFMNEDYMSKAMRMVEVVRITSQLAQTAGMLVFLGDQFRRVQKLEAYVK